MSGNKDLILAGVEGGGTGNALCYVAREGATAPTSASSTLNVSATNEVQTVTVTGTPTGGTFTLSYGGQTTSALAYNAAASAVQTALLALSTIGAGNATVSGGAGGPYTVTFVGDLAGENVNAITAAASLTGGTTPGVTVVTATPGVAAWVDAGWCDESGLAEKIAQETKEIPAFGSVAPVRRLLTKRTETFDITFLESNPLTVAIYYGLEPGSVTADANGEFDVSTGQPTSNRFSVVFETVDGDNLRRVYCPSVEAVPGDTAVTAGEAIKLPVTLTAYPDDTGVAVYRFWHLDALAS